LVTSSGPRTPLLGNDNLGSGALGIGYQLFSRNKIATSRLHKCPGCVQPWELAESVCEPGIALAGNLDDADSVAVQRTRRFARSRKDIIVNADSSGDARHTTENMIPDDVVTGVRRVK